MGEFHKKLIINLNQTLQNIQEEAMEQLERNIQENLEISEKNCDRRMKRNTRAAIYVFWPW